MLPENDEDGALTPRPGRNRSSSFAPSLTLPFLAGDASTPDAGPVGGLGWFADGDTTKKRHDGDNDSEDGAGSDGEERVRCKSPFGIETFASDDDEERVDATAIWNEGKKEEEARLREISYDPSKKPELQRMSVAYSFAGVLEGFGLGKPEATGSDDEGEGGGGTRTNAYRKSMSSNRISIHRDNNSDSEDEDDGRPLSMILLNDKRPLTDRKLTLEPPRLDLPMDFAVGDKEDSDSEEEDEAPLAFKNFNTSLGAAPAERTYDNDNEADDDDDNSEDDVPLAAKQEDDKPLGQVHPVAALNQQMELQQQQNAALMAHMQLQYQYALQMQLQQAIIQQGELLSVQDAKVPGGGYSLLRFLSSSRHHRL